jgi:hypothetical protein
MRNLAPYFSALGSTGVGHRLPFDAGFAPKAAGAGASAALSNRVLERVQMFSVAGVTGLDQQGRTGSIKARPHRALHERSKL